MSDPRTIIRSRDTNVVCMQSGHCVILINQDQREESKYVGAFLSIEEADELIATLQKDVAIAKAERARDSAMTDDERRRLFDDVCARLARG